MQIKCLHDHEQTVCAAQCSKCEISPTGLRRRAPESAPCVLVVRDTQQHIFGCFTSESWRVAPRYYGTGESFVFQIQVHLLAPGLLMMLLGTQCRKVLVPAVHHCSDARPTGHVC